MTNSMDNSTAINLEIKEKILRIISFLINLIISQSRVIYE